MIIYFSGTGNSLYAAKKLLADGVHALTGALLARYSTAKEQSTEIDMLIRWKNKRDFI